MAGISHMRTDLVSAFATPNSCFKMSDKNVEFSWGLRNQLDLLCALLKLAVRKFVFTMCCCVLHPFPLKQFSYWWPVCRSSMVLSPNAKTKSGHPGHRPFGARILGRPIVLYRQKDGSPVCLEDKCPHKGAQLSLGRVINGT